MPTEMPVALTQRAYTLRLRPAISKDEPSEEVVRKTQEIQDALWATHEAVNKGAKVFGDWLLVLRGGLDHNLQDAKVKEGRNKSERNPTPDERRNRRILLALSWLSVEDERGALDDHESSAIIAYGDGCITKKDGQEVRTQKVVEALCDILKKREVPIAEIGDTHKKSEEQPGTWLGDCVPSLSSAIREDAVWVNRSAMFDQVTKDWNCLKARKDANTLLSFILGEDFLTIPTPKKTKRSGSKSDEDENQGERRQAIIASSKGAGQRTRHPFSHLFGAGNPFGKPTRSLSLRDNWHAYLRRLIEGIGLPLVRMDGSRKGKRRADTDGPAHTELQREMFSKAASRLAQIWTKHRQQEADRQARKTADADLTMMEQDPEYESALRALLNYCEDYRDRSGATGKFRIRPRQAAGWDRVVARWQTIQETDSDQAREKRVEIVKELQDSDPEKKFGDPNLFFRLADEHYRDVWWRNGKSDHSILTRYVAGMKARSDAVRLKVTSYRHPDAYRNPIFCQFGVSRPKIEFRRLKAFSKHAEGNDPRAVGMLLWYPKAHSAKFTVLHGVSRRLDREIGAACDAVSKDASELPEISRRSRLGAAATGLSVLDAPARVAGVFDLKPIAKRQEQNNHYSEEEEEKQESDDETLKEPKWNGTLSTNRRDLVAICDILDRARKTGDVASVASLRIQALNRHQHLRWTLTVSMEMEGRGPWFRYIDSSDDKRPFLRTSPKDIPNDKSDLTKGLKRRKGDAFISWDGWPWEELNKPLKEKVNLMDGELPSLVADTKAARGDKACLILSRLPVLRVLSVDLGQRFAAACAVWEALGATGFKIKDEIASAKRKGCHVEGSPDSLFVHVIRKKTKEKRHKNKEIEETTIYRRIGEDFLRNSKTGELTDIPHPAPWARLDRQFLVKLQGEELPIREASNEEIYFVYQLERQMGLATPLIDRLVRAGWGGKAKQPQRVETLRQLGWQPQPESEAVLRGDKKKLDRWRAPSLRVDDLISATVQNARFGLRRHADLARIAFGLNCDHKPMPGDRKYWFHKSQDDDLDPEKEADKKAAERAAKHTDYLQEVLMLWFELVVSGKWRDEDALNWWNERILLLIQAAPFTEPPSLVQKEATDKRKVERWNDKCTRWRSIWENTLRRPLARAMDEHEEQRDSRDRKSDREAIRALLQPVANNLRENLQLRELLHKLWADRWVKDEGRRRHSLTNETRSDFRHISRIDIRGRKLSITSAKVETSGWHRLLGQLRDWLLPHGLRTHLPESDGERTARKARYKATRNVGGVSLTRIDSLVEFRRTIIQFRTAGTPWGRVEIGPDGKPTEARREVGEKYAQHLLDVIDQLREQRSKQLASRIAEAALGIGSEKREHWTDGRKRPRGPLYRVDASGVENGDRHFKPCEAVVIERLDDYKPDEVRGKRENRMLASWRKADFKKRLAETCQLHGLHLREVMPNYTSRQCSRTGLPGIRCDDVPVDEFLAAPWWRKIVEAAKKKLQEEKDDQTKLASNDSFFLDLDAAWRKASVDSKAKQMTLRLPRSGGDVFVAAPAWDQWNKVGKENQAKLAKRALQADLNAAANIGLRALLDPDFPGRWWYVPCSAKDGTPAKDKVIGAACLDLSACLVEGSDRTAAKREYVNAWHDPSPTPIQRANYNWSDTGKYWNEVRCRVIAALRVLNGLG